MARPPIDDATALVTGASSGIGREMARQLAGRASSIAVVARREERLRELKSELEGEHEGLEVVVAPCDLADPEATEAMLTEVEEAAGPVDVLINNAGLGDFGLFEEGDPETDDLQVDVNVRAVLRLTRKVLPGMVERGRGGILNVSSGFGLTFMPGFATYVGTKHFVSGWTEALRCEMAGTGVAVTHVCPGPVETEFADKANESEMDMPGFTYITAEKCARQALRGFEKGRALVIPGWILWALTNLGRVTPRPILRLLYGWLGKRHLRTSG